jgi:hypothetical protein
LTDFFDFADRHPLVVTVWVLAAAFALANEPFKLLSFVRNVYERVDPKDTGSE